MGTWAQGEHFAIVGDTGSGKTFLESRLVDYRGFNLFLRSKPDDNHFPGFERIRRARDIGSGNNYILEPAYELQAREFLAALETIWRSGGWTVWFDELYYLTLLKLEKAINKLLTQGRSKGITCVCGMQRPAGVTRFALSQATHWCVFAQEGRDLKTLSDAGSPQVASLVPTLKRFEFAYWNRKTRELRAGKAQQLAQILGAA